MAAQTASSLVTAFLKANFDTKNGKVLDLTAAAKTIPLPAIAQLLTSTKIPESQHASLKFMVSQVVNAMPDSHAGANAVKKMLSTTNGGSNAGVAKPPSATSAPSATAPKPKPKAPAAPTPTAPAIKAFPSKKATISAAAAAIPQHRAVKVTSSGRLVKPPASGALSLELSDYDSAEDSDFNPNDVSEDSVDEAELSENEVDEVVAKPRGGTSGPPDAAPAAKRAPVAAKAQPPSTFSEEKSDGSDLSEDESGSEEDSEEEEEEDEDEDESSSSEEDTDLSEDSGAENDAPTKDLDLIKQLEVEMSVEAVNRRRAIRSGALQASHKLIEDAFQKVAKEELEEELEGEFRFNRRTDGWKRLKQLMKEVYALPTKGTRVLGLPGDSPIVYVLPDSEYDALWTSPKDEGARLLLRSMVSLFGDHGVRFEIDCDAGDRLRTYRMPERIEHMFLASKAPKAARIIKS